MRHRSTVVFLVVVCAVLALTAHLASAETAGEARYARTFPTVLAASAGRTDPGGPPPSLPHGGFGISDHASADGISSSERYQVELAVASPPLRSATTATALYPFYPQAGTLWQDLWVNNFVDLDPSPGIKDWDCSGFTYNGHNGHDTDIRSFREQAIGVPVFAVLDATVSAAHDGEPDMNTTAPNVPANYVILTHAGGQQTFYWHLKNGSVAVQPGQTILAGTQIGLTASSGNSTWPHLHFESHIDGAVFEPSAGPCRTGPSYWVNQVPIRRDTYVRDITVSSAPFAGLNALPWDQGPHTGTFVTGVRTVAFWVGLANQPAAAGFRIRFVRPNGTAALDSSGSFSGPAYRKSEWWWSFSPNLDALGTWKLVFDLNGQTLVEAPFVVVASQAEVVNRPPAAVTAALDPAAPNAADVVFCRIATNLTAEDPDYDVVRYRYVWSVNGSVVRDVSSAALSDAVSRSVVQGGTYLGCSVTPSDGQASAPATTASANVAVGPPPPSPPVRCRVPNLIGLRLVTARARIRARNCRIGAVRRALSRRVGGVISQRPRGGVVRPRGFRVNLVVGRA